MNSSLVAFERILVAVLVGLLIGLDRERAEMRKRRRQFAGVRTFPLISLAGAIPALLVEQLGPILVIASFLAFAALTVVAYYRTTATGKVGATTETAALVTFLLGTLAGTGQLLLAGAIGLAVAVLLVAKPRLEGFSRALSEEELAATLELAVISCIVLPLLPNQTYGPYDVLNPFDIWLVVVLVSALSFAGFVAMRLFGDQRGIIVAGVVGALVSSTAVTASMAHRSREEARLANGAATAAVLASVVMCVRIALLAGVVGPGILPRLLPVLGAMTASGAVIAWVLAKKAAPSKKPSGTHITNPFSLQAAVTFAVLYALVLLLVRAAQAKFGAAGVQLAAALSSLVDVDAVTIAVARGGPGVSGWRDPAMAVTIAAVMNTLVKLGIAVVLGAGSFRRYVAIALTLMSIAGVSVGMLVYLRF